MGQDIYCSVCGGPFDRSDSTWIEAALLLTIGTFNDKDVLSPVAFSYDIEEGEFQLIQNPGEFQYDSDFRLLSPDDDRQVRVFAADYGRNAPSIPLYIPIHETCMRLVEDLIRYRQSASEQPENSIIDKRTFWKVLSARFRSTRHGPFGAHGTVSKGVLPEPNDYFGGSIYRNVTWEVDDHEEEMAVIIEADPYDASTQSAFEPFENEDWREQAPADASPALLNRRRIWQLLASARIGDVPIPQGRPSWRCNREPPYPGWVFVPPNIPPPGYVKYYAPNK